MSGLQAVLAPLTGLRLSAECLAIEDLVEQVRTGPPTVILLELAADVTLPLLNSLHAIAANTKVVLRVDWIATDFASKAILGVRGVLRKDLPLDLQVKCLEKVAAGKLWFKKGTQRQASRDQTRV